MARLPTPGSDNNIWGDILNDFLGVAHKNDGNVKNGYIENAHIASGAGIAQAKIQSLVSDLAGKVGKDTLVVNVHDHGAAGDGSTDDTFAIQSAINNSADGATIFFPAGVYLVSSAIVLKENRSYVGGGAAYSGADGGAVIKQKDGVNIDGASSLSGILVANAWATNASFCDNPITVTNLAIDGNASNNPGSTACGIVLVNFNSGIVSCLITNVSTHGVLLTDTTDDGTTVSNSCSENWVVQNKIDNPDADGIHQVSGNGNSNQDGFCVGNLVSSTTGAGIRFARAAGWEFRRNHLYTIAQHGMHLSNTFGTLVEGNYVEDFGNEATAAEFYNGIYASQLNGFGSVIMGNSVSCSEPSSSVGGYEYVGVISGSSQTNANIIVTNNAIIGPSSPTTKGLGVVMQNGSGGTLHVRCNNNRIRNINTAAFIDSSVLVYEQGEQLTEHPTTGASTSQYGGPARGTGAPSVGGSGNDFYGTLTFGTGTGATTGVVGGISFETNFADTPVIILTPGNAATAGLQPYVDSVGSSFIDMGVNVAPSDGQPADTYVINYAVFG